MEFPEIPVPGTVNDMGKGGEVDRSLVLSLPGNFSEVNKDYTFFTHATFFVHQGLDPFTQDPAVAWAESEGLSPKDGILIRETVNYDMFTGLGPEWNRTILGVRKDYLDRFLLDMCGVITVHGHIGEFPRTMTTSYTVVRVPTPGESGKSMEVAVMTTIDLLEEKAVSVKGWPTPHFEVIRVRSGDILDPSVSFEIWASSRYNAAEDAFYREFSESVARSYAKKGKILENQTDVSTGREARTEQGDG